MVVVFALTVVGARNAAARGDDDISVSLDAQTAIVVRYYCYYYGTAYTVVLYS